jgi:16S rRNA (cytosine967-C5)-methyltransferase
LVKSSTSSKIKKFSSESGFDGFYMALLERKEEILKPKEIKAEIEPAGAKE